MINVRIPVEVFRNFNFVIYSDGGRFQKSNIDSLDFNCDFGSNKSGRNINRNKVVKQSLARFFTQKYVL